LVGAQVTDHVFLLMTDKAVRIMFGPSSVTLGADVGVAAGPVGRSAEADWAVAAGDNAGIYTYSYSKGLYAGVSLDGKVVVTRNDVNEKFYGRKVTGEQILGGEVPVPPAAQPLYDALARCRHYAVSSSSSIVGSSSSVASSRSQWQYQDRLPYDPLRQADPALGHFSAPQGYYYPSPATLPGPVDDPAVMGEYGETFVGGAGIGGGLPEEAGGFGAAPGTAAAAPASYAPHPSGPPPGSFGAPPPRSQPPPPATASPPSGAAGPPFQAQPTIASLPPPPASSP
jgi:hypothetical protein